MMISTKLLRCKWPPNPGVLPGDAQFDAVFDDISKNGVLSPLTIDLEWFILDGCHRISAARLLGIEYVPVRVWTGTEFVE